MTNTRSNLAHRSCVRPQRTFLVTALAPIGAAGVLGCGPTATQPGTDTWLARTNADGMLAFTDTSGFDAVNDVVGCESTIGIVFVPLAPIATTPALASSAALFDQVTVSPTTQLLTQ